jgi:hypothetical protein
MERPGFLAKCLIIPEGRVKRGDRAVPIKLLCIHCISWLKRGIRKSPLKGSFPLRSPNGLSGFEMASDNDSLDRSRMYRRDGAPTTLAPAAPALVVTPSTRTGGLTSPD